MKELFKYFGIAFVIIFSLQSCKPDDIYYNLSEDAKEFLLFEVDDTFKLKDLSTNEIITLTVMSKEIEHYGVSSPSGHISFGPSGNINLERGEYVFTDNLNCYDGIVTVEAKEDGGFELKMSLDNCFGENFYSFGFYDEFFLTIDVEGVEYPNAYLLRSDPDILYYSKEKGILKIMNYYNEETRFTIVE